MTSCDCGADKAKTTHAEWCSSLGKPPETPALDAAVEALKPGGKGPKDATWYSGDDDPMVADLDRRMREWAEVRRFWRNQQRGRASKKA